MGHEGTGRLRIGLLLRVALVAILAFSNIVFYVTYQGSSEKYNSLWEEYKHLVSKKLSLKNDYGNLEGYYEELGVYNTLDIQYSDLSNGYSSLKEAYETLLAGGGYGIRDPTYNEVLKFISSDKTDENEYDPESYTCINFAADVKNNAFYKGYRCGYVEILFPDSGHAIVCFNTADRGLVFIEPQTDEVMNLVIGRPYWNRSKYCAPDYDDTVIRFVICW
ncbi:MAG: hypothetical protein ACUVV4_07295 [Candidatus Bathyarchaeia archaeon]